MKKFNSLVREHELWFNKLYDLLDESVEKSMFGTMVVMDSHDRNWFLYDASEMVVRALELERPQEKLPASWANLLKRTIKSWTTLFRDQDLSEGQRPKVIHDDGKKSVVIE